jgi:sugar phosphate isomerase/epimerase
VPVFQDVGGEDRPISDTHLKHCTYVSPNLTELRRLTGMHVDGTDEESIVAAARSLQTRGARNVLVTLGDCGSMLLAEDGRILWQSACPVGSVVDETGAGDNFRGAFVVAHFIDMLGLEESLQFASAAGAVSVSKMGAIPSCGTREEVQTALARMSALKTLHLRGGVVGVMGTADPMTDECPCPYEFASRLNSMQARPELWSGPSGVRGWVRRQGLIKGLSLVDFNYPQHITAKTVDSEARDELLATLQDSGLRCGAVCLRFPKSMQLGAFTHPDAAVRREAIQLTKEACAWSAALGANEVVVWSAFDGYDYPLQADYDAMWVDVVSAFQEVCDAYPGVKVSLEYKPTDENTRFFAVPSTGAAVLLIGHVDRANFGLTLDFGHCLMAGENPAQAVAMVPKGKLFGVQLGDGYGRLGAEDGLAFASVHPRSALEFVVWLIKKDFRGHIYFDTFPRNEDPVREAEYNIRQFRRLYSAARKMLASGRLEEQLLRHDSMAVLEDLESMFL